MSLLADRLSEENVRLTTEEMLEQIAKNASDIAQPTKPKIANILNIDNPEQDIANKPTGHDEYNKKAFEAQAGWNGAALTADAAFKKQKEEALAAKTANGARAMARSFDPIQINTNSFLNNIKLDNNYFVDIREDGILMVRGDGEGSPLREATLDEKIQLEDQSQACSVGLTSDELEMNAYLNGQTDIIPDSLRQMAEDIGVAPESLTRDDYQDMILEKYADSPHIAMRIVSSDTLTTSPLDINGGLLPSSFSTVPAAEGGIAANNLQSSWAGAALPQTSAPNMSPIPQGPGLSNLEPTLSPAAPALS